MLFARPLLQKWFIKKTVPTNHDVYFGKTTKLLADVVEGVSTIKLGDVIWTAVCDEPLKKDDVVEIIKTEGNKYIVKGGK